MWNAIPQHYSTLKIVVLCSVMSIFSSTYSCESLLSEINVVKSNSRNLLTDEFSMA